MVLVISFLLVGSPALFLSFNVIGLELCPRSDSVPGVIDVKNLGRVMNAVGLEPSEAELLNMITEVDGSGKKTLHCYCWFQALTPSLGKGAVDFAEFMKMMSRGGTSTASELKETFGMLNSGGG